MREKGELSIPNGGYSLICFNILDMKVLSDCLKARLARIRNLGPHRSFKGVLGWDDEPFRRFFEKSPIPMTIDDIHQSRGPKICLQINDSFKKLFGYSLKEIRNLNDWFRRAFPDMQYQKKNHPQMGAGYPQGPPKRGSHAGSPTPLTDQRWTERGGGAWGSNPR